MVSNLWSMKALPFFALTFSCFVSVFLLVSQDAVSAQNGTPFFDGPGGASCRYYNQEYALAWESEGGDVVDATGKKNGSVPFGSASFLSSKSYPRRYHVDVTEAYRASVRAGEGSLGLVLKRSPDGKGGSVRIASRKDPKLSPFVAYGLSDGSVVVRKAASTAEIDCSTKMAKGVGESLSVGRGNAVFDAPYPVLGNGVTVRKAFLLFYGTRTFGGGASVGVFRLAKPEPPRPATVPGGIAAAFSGDRNLASSPDVYYALDFDPGDEVAKNLVDQSKKRGDFADIVGSDPGAKFVPFSGNALRVNLAKGSNVGLGLQLPLKDRKGAGEPTEAYLRYYVRFGDNWKPTVDGGKMPGFAGTYGKAGWGGRKPDGTDGWSARGSFRKWGNPDNPLYGKTVLGNYAYYADQRGSYGDIWDWNAAVPNNEWHFVEQYVRLNTPKKHDGVIRVWVDGRQVFEKNNLMMRTVDSLKIETAWLNVYHGGTAVSPHDQYVYFDNVVVAKKYVGPALATSFAETREAVRQETAATEIPAPAAGPDSTEVESVPSRPVTESPKPGPWSPSWNDGMEGVSRDYSDAAKKISWSRKQGDYSDRLGTLFGTSPYVGFSFSERSFSKAEARFDVTELVKAEISKGSGEANLFLFPDAAKNGGSVFFASRESDDPVDRPTLTLRFSDGTEKNVEPFADAEINPSTYKGRGTVDAMQLSQGGWNVVLGFPLSGAAGKTVTQASVRLVSTKRFAPQSFSVFRLEIPKDAGSR